MTCTAEPYIRKYKAALRSFCFQPKLHAVQVFGFEAVFVYRVPPWHRDKTKTTGLIAFPHITTPIAVWNALSPPTHVGCLMGNGKGFVVSG